MVKRLCHLTNERKVYEKALEDFGVTELIAKLLSCSSVRCGNDKMYLEQEEAESLAAALINRLTNTIHNEWVASYLDATGKSSCNVLPTKLHLPSVDLPVEFPHEAEIPHFLYGDKLRWRNSEESCDWGIVIGRFYSFAPHLCTWAWCYVIYLSKDSPSSAWVFCDTAWEDDLEPMSEGIHQ